MICSMRCPHERLRNSSWRGSSSRPRAMPLAAGFDLDFDARWFGWSNPAETVLLRRCRRRFASGAGRLGGCGDWGSTKGRSPRCRRLHIDPWSFTPARDGRSGVVSRADQPRADRRGCLRAIRCARADRPNTLPAPILTRRGALSRPANTFDHCRIMCPSKAAVLPHQPVARAATNRRRRVLSQFSCGIGTSTDCAARLTDLRQPRCCRILFRVTAIPWADRTVPVVNLSWRVGRLNGGERREDLVGVRSVPGNDPRVAGLQ
jgi:hypothetical protein